MGNFTFEEMNLMCIYNTGSRTGLIDSLREMHRAFAGGNGTEGADRQCPYEALCDDR